MTQELAANLPEYTDEPNIRILRERVDERGVAWLDLHVDDVSEYSAEGEILRTTIAEYDKQLKLHPDIPGPVVVEKDGIKELLPNNVFSEAVYAAPGMHEWRRDLVPTAMALYPLYRPDSTHLPSGGEIDEATRDFFTNALDSIGIRTRGALMASVSSRYINHEGTTRWVSLACGAAVPVLDALRQSGADDDVRIELVDIDTTALDFAQALAEDQGMKQDEQFVRHQRNLVKDMIIADTLVQDFGENSAQLVDALGIFEYFSDRASVPFLKNSYRLVDEGGALVIANMLDTHPNLDFNQRCIGWPKIYPRSPEEILSLVERAGIPLDKVSFMVPEDGVYAVLEIKK